MPVENDLGDGEPEEERQQGAGSLVAHRVEVPKRRPQQGDEDNGKHRQADENRLIGRQWQMRLHTPDSA
jgi:hypothetical protein